MSILKKIFSNALENYLLAIKNDKTCSYRPYPDTFDGKLFTIDEFNKTYQKFFDDPGGFYIDNKETSPLNFRKGEHFNKKQSYQSKFNPQSYLFDAPIKTIWPENNLIPFKWFTNDKKRSNTILLFAPGGWRPNYKAEELFCNKLYEGGIDAGLMTVPYQIERTPSLANYSGEYFISGNVFFTIENFRVFVAEIRRMVQYLKQHYQYVGLIGMSSGGFYTGITADIEEIDFLFPYITGCKLGSITFNGKITKFAKKHLLENSIDEDALNKAWSISDQLNLGKHLKAKYVKHYIALYDLIVPTEYQFLLWEVYGKQAKLELETGHTTSYFMFDKITKDIIDFVKERTL